MKEEAKGGRNCNKCLLEFPLNYSSNDAFKIGAGFSIVVWAKLCKSRIKTETQR